MSDRPLKTFAEVSENHFLYIGMVVAIWSHIEMMMEIAICGLYEIDPDRGLVLTNNIGFQSRLALLRILAKRGAVKDSQLARDCIEILKRIEKGYTARNEIAHGCWRGTDDPAHAYRMAIRARGDRLRCIKEAVSIDELGATMARLDRLRVDLGLLLGRLGIIGPD